MANIKNIPIMERPYEKLIMYGEKTLTNTELLSIIIKSGTKDESSIEIAQKLLNLDENLRFLQTISIQELMKINGIGKVKAVELKAVGEIAKRISKPLNTDKIKINSKEDVAKLLLEEMQNEKNEILKILMLNNQNYLKKITTIAVGNESNIVVNVKAILSEPVRMQIPKIILVHNHPSGSAIASKIDIEFTKKIKQAANILDIQLIDHIIIGDGEYQSIIF